MHTTSVLARTLFLSPRIAPAARVTSAAAFVRRSARTRAAARMASTQVQPPSAEAAAAMQPARAATASSASATAAASALPSVSAISVTASTHPPPQTTRTWCVSPDSSPAELEAALAEPAALLRQGELVAFPTETVYGLGGNALSSSALSGIYNAKGRPSDNPLIVHIHSHAQFLSLGRNIPALAMALAERFWPGPLTLIVPTSLDEHQASSAARAGLDCVGVRMPNHPVALALLRAAGVPLAAPSANLSGRPSPTTAAHVAADLTGRIAGIVDGGAAEGVGLESTVVECSADGAEDDGKGWVTILRPGGVTREMLEQVAGAGRVRLDPALVQSTVQVDALQAPVQSLPKQTARRGAERAHVSELLGSPSSSSAAAAAAASSSSPSPSPVPPVVSPGPKAPGMKYTHYAPRAPLLLVEDGASDNASPSSMIDLLLRTAASYVARGDVVGILATAASRPSIEVWLKAQGLSPSQQVVVQWCGTGRVTESDLGSVARDLYACLRAFDDTAVQIILSESFPEAGGLGEAVMNRLRKAAGGRVVRQQQAADASASAATPNKP